MGNLSEETRNIIRQIKIYQGNFFSLKTIPILWFLDTANTDYPSNTCSKSISCVPHSDQETINCSFMCEVTSGLTSILLD